MYILGHTGIASGLAALFGERIRNLSIDFRAVLFGSMLPDIIDKPAGIALGISGRAAAHTGIFALGLTLFALLAAFRGRWGLVWLAFGNWTHLVLDGMWLQPAVLLYPAFGTSFPPDTVTVLSLILTFLRDPILWAGEIVGGAVLLALAVRHGVTTWASLKRLLTSGQVPSRP